MFSLKVVIGLLLLKSCHFSLLVGWNSSGLGHFQAALKSMRYFLFLGVESGFSSTNIGIVLTGTSEVDPST